MKLEIGSVLYSEGFGCSFEKYIIDRVTAQRAYVKINDTGYEYVFNREIECDLYARRIGGSKGYGRPIYRLETPELQAKYHLAFMRRKFDTIKSSQLSTEQLEQILVIAFPKKGPGMTQVHGFLCGPKIYEVDGIQIERPGSGGPCPLLKDYAERETAALRDLVRRMRDSGCSLAETIHGNEPCAKVFREAWDKACAEADKVVKP